MIILVKTRSVQIFTGSLFLADRGSLLVSAEGLGITLSIGTINQCIHEAGRAVAPLEEPLKEALLKSELVHSDETPWKESGKKLWLWVFTSVTVCFFMVASRSKSVVTSILGEKFDGWIMSDGYNAYRSYTKRLRCWAHLIRKARGIKESLSKDEGLFGAYVLDTLNFLMQEVYKAREGPGEILLEKHQALLARLKKKCEKYRDSAHDKTRALAREFLNDWDAIFRVLAFPYLPLTNNEAERKLRPWVIFRKLSFGTRSPEGTRVFYLLASVIETCKMRQASPWKYIANAVELRRKGMDVPALPEVVTA